MNEQSEGSGSGHPNLPTEAQARKIARWLAGPRSRALRRAAIGQRQRVLEVGCGHGTVTAELARRAQGTVTTLDHYIPPRESVKNSPVRCARGDARALPFQADSFDLVFFQNTLLWIADMEAAISEAARVLQQQGVIVALEPDYGGMMEHPDWGIRQLWIQGLSQAGADPLVGRKLPGACESVGLSTWVELAHIPQPAQAEALELLYDLPLTVRQRKIVENAAQGTEAAAGQWSLFLHVPYFLIVATKP